MKVETISIIYVVIFFAAILIISFWASKKKAGGDKDTATEHFLGGKSVPFFVLAMSYVATFASAGTFMGDPAFTSIVGYPYLWFGIFLVPGCVLVGLLLIRKMRIQSEKMGCLTPIEYLGARYKSPFLRMFISITMICCFSLVLLAQTKAASILLNHFIGIPFNVALIINIIGLLIVCIAGGLRSVAYTDAVQGGLMVALCIILISAGLVATGGFAGVEAELSVQHPEMVQFIQPGLFDELGVFGIIGLAIFSFCVMPSLPYLTARYMAMKDVTKKTVGKFSIVALFASGLFCLMPINGLTGRVLFPNAEADYISVTLATGLLHPLISCGIMIGFLAAIISTASSVLLTVSQGVGRDILDQIKPGISLKTQVWAANVTCICVMIFCLVFNLTNPPPIFQLFNLIGQTGVGSAIFMPLFCGVLWKNSTKEGAIASAIVGVVSTAIFAILPVGFPIAMGVPAVCAAITMFVVSYIVNKIKGPNEILQKLQEI